MVKVPYDAKVTLKCVSPTAKLLTFIKTTLDLDQNLWNGLSPYLFVYSNLTIDHFAVKNRGFYSCTTNVTTKSLQRTLITTSEFDPELLYLMWVSVNYVLQKCWFYWRCYLPLVQKCERVTVLSLSVSQSVCQSFRHRISRMSASQIWNRHQNVALEILGLILVLIYCF